MFCRTASRTKRNCWKFTEISALVFLATSRSREHTQLARHGRHAVADIELEPAPGFTVEFSLEHAAGRHAEFDPYLATQRHDTLDIDDDAVRMSRLGLEAREQQQIVRPHVSKGPAFERGLRRDRAMRAIDEKALAVDMPLQLIGRAKKLVDKRCLRMVVDLLRATDLLDRTAV